MDAERMARLALQIALLPFEGLILDRLPFCIREGFSTLAECNRDADAWWEQQMRDMETHR
jgi:hypothetical protein